MKKNRKVGLILAIVAIIVVGIIFTMPSEEKTVTTINYSTLVKELKDQNVAEIEIIDTVVNAKLKEGGAVISYLPSILEHDYILTKYIIPSMETGDIKVRTPKPKTDSLLVTLLPTIIMVGVFAFFMFFMIKGVGGGGRLLSVGKSKAKKSDEGKKVTFKDVAGLEEEKQELMEVVDFLKHPRKYVNIGARIPKGLLLVGPPGTGKTYISRATSGEAGVPFFTISGSDFVEMFVGVGASRVRDLFAEAKKKTPCIIFIDEIDAVGRRRGAGFGGGHDEREQTLNQLLVEMDGFGQNSGVIILAATNRPDILDPALLRPGRFDRQIVIGRPDVKGREEIFKVHSKNKRLADDVNAKTLAKRTVGFTPADIENMLNEAALLAARRDGQKIRMEEIEEAITKVIVGPKKKSRVITEAENKLTAYHEAGHAIINREFPNLLDKVHQITIIPHGFAGGFTMSLPEKDESYITKRKMEVEIIALLGGRIAEKITFGDISTGASNDIQRATEIAREMVMKFGFSDKVGTINYSHSEEVFLGNDYHNIKMYSEDTAKLIDSEVKAIIDNAFKKGEKILTTRKTTLKTIAEALLEVETLDGDQFERLYTKKITLKGIIKENDAETKKNKKIHEEEAKQTKAERRKEKLRLAQEQAKKAENPYYKGKGGKDGK